ncbi:MAG: helix-turn-helix domain-containing protein [Chitinophagaceae bacterium]|nr:MAG: helix-turn-helix domain-containing protein [Chitinophagaceae bacterium]
MVKKAIPVYDIPAIDEGARHGLLAAQLSGYVQRHYEHLHHPHRHSFYHLVLFTAGHGWHTIDFHRYPVQQGAAYFMSPGQVHGWEFEGPVEGYVVHFNETFFRSFLQDDRYLERFPFFSGDAAQGVCQLEKTELTKAVALFEGILGEATLDANHSIDLVRLQLLHYFILVERHCSSLGAKTIPAQKSLLLRNFRRLIEEHYAEWRLPKHYADVLYVTPNHLNALCRDLLGKTAGDLIRERVLLEAKRLLTAADLSVAAIADTLRFEDASYFGRFFRKYEGTTPEQFRKQQFSHRKTE